MISFKDFLAEREPLVRSEEAEQERVREEWTTAVAGLIAEIEGWIRTSDSNHLVKLSARVTPSVEWPIEGHLLPELEISLGGRSVTVHPQAMNILGPRWKPSEGRWAGRVDLLGRPDKYEVFRFTPIDGPASWFIRDDRGFELLPWSQATLEAALMVLLA